MFIIDVLIILWIRIMNEKIMNWFKSCFKSNEEMKKEYFPKMTDEIPQSMTSITTTTTSTDNDSHMYMGVVESGQSDLNGTTLVNIMIDESYTSPEQPRNTRTKESIRKDILEKISILFFQK